MHRLHLLLDALEEHSLLGLDVLPETLAERGQPLVEPRRGVAVQVPNLCPHVVVLVNKAVDQRTSISNVLHDGGKQMGFLRVEVRPKDRLEELDEQVHLPSAVSRPRSPRRRRAAKDEPLREHEPVVMLAGQRDETLVALQRAGSIRGDDACCNSGRTGPSDDESQRRHLAVQLGVGGPIDLPHPPLADEGGHVVMVEAETNLQ